MNDRPQINVNISTHQISAMAQLVERAVERSIKAFLEFDSILAKMVIDGDKAINSFEIDIDNSTFNIFSMSTTDMPPTILRLILSIQKINPMLERIGDHAVNIAESAQTLAREARGCKLFELPLMADHCLKIVRDALKSFFYKDQVLAEEVLARDDDIDKLNVSILAEVKADVLNGMEGLSFENALEIIRICKNLERIADLGSNIAEEALFSIEGKIVKHHATGIGVPMQMEEIGVPNG
ncbi:MAG: phosphate signaling complex protein PhoU [Chitinivibrionales bacterium]|nr:phosphate signaling complex protein PhoU [Chitinivibrionales bacterium]